MTLERLAEIRAYLEGRTGKTTGIAQELLVALDDCREVLRRINNNTSISSVFGNQTHADSLYMPTGLILRILDGEE